MLIVKSEFKEMYAEAMTRAVKMVDCGLYSRFNLSKDKRVEKAAVGCLGEIAFKKILEICEVPYQTDEESYDNRNSDDFDYLVNGKIIDVKVAKKSTQNMPSDKWTYGYPEEQQPSRKDFIVVGWVDFKNEEIGFYGWIKGNQISNYEVVRENSYASYGYYTPNHEFPWGALNKDFSKLKGNILGETY